MTGKPTKQEVDTMMILLAMAKHIARCTKCAQLQADIMNHAQIPSKNIEVKPQGK